MDLLDRYLAAISGELPEAQRADVTAELRDVLLSQVEDREEALGRPLDQKEMEALLKAFGHPLVVAGRYRTFNHLIGPEVFPFYWFSLKLILGFAVAIHVITSAVLFAARGHVGEVGDLIGAVLENLIPNMVMVVGWTTLAFVAIEYAGAGKHLLRWRPRDLPAPHARVRKSRSELVVSLAFGIVFFMWWAGMADYDILWWTRLAPYQHPSLEPFTRADSPLRIVLTPIWADLHAPILAMLGAGVVLNAFDLARPNFNRLNAVLGIAFCLGWLVLAALLLQAGSWIDVGGAATGSAQAARLEHFANVGVFWGLVATIIVCLWEVAAAGWRLVRISRFQVGVAR